MTNFLLGALAAHAYFYIHIFIHELAHAFVMTLLKVKIATIETGGDSIGFTLFGVRFGFGGDYSRGCVRTPDGYGLSRVSSLRRAAVYIAGPMVDFSLAPFIMACALVYAPDQAVSFIAFVAVWFLNLIAGSLQSRGDLKNFFTNTAAHFS